MVAKIYIEGAAPGHLADTQFRKAWSEFFQKAGIPKEKFSPVRGQSRQETYNSFVAALKIRKINVLPLLLVDSEAPLNPAHSLWEHLAKRDGDGWKKPDGATEEHIFLMVQLMETWFLADREMLKQFFQPDFIEKHIPKREDLEAIPKLDVYAALEAATAKRPIKKRYAKGEVSFNILSKLSPQKVENLCPHAARLLNFLRKM